MSLDLLDLNHFNDLFLEAIDFYFSDLAILGPSSGGPLITIVPDSYIVRAFTNFVTFLTDSIESLPHGLYFLYGFHVLSATVEHLRRLGG